VTEDLERSVRLIHDLEKATRFWELLRDSAQQVINESNADAEYEGDSVETDPSVAKARRVIAACDTYIIAAKTQIDELERGN
jgi:hypothetical protein